jgi:ABC-type multidrug transport system ATPase subunit
MSQIEIINISKSFGGERVLDSFSQTLPDSGAVVLMGPSGAGKTTLLRVLAGLIPADSGEIRGMENKRVSVVFQEDRLLPWLTARENIEVVGKSGEINGEEWLSRFGMEAAAGKYPANSAGACLRRGRFPAGRTLSRTRRRNKGSRYECSCRGNERQACRAGYARHGGG